MAIKIAVLKSGEDVIADVKEIIDKETQKQLSLMFSNPYIVTVEQTGGTMYLTESAENEYQTQINFSKWIPLTEDTDIMVPYEWVVTFVEPHKDILKSYTEKFGGTENDSASSAAE